MRSIQSMRSISHIFNYVKVVIDYTMWLSKHLATTRLMTSTLSGLNNKVQKTDIDDGVSQFLASSNSLLIIGSRAAV